MDDSRCVAEFDPPGAAEVSLSAALVPILMIVSPVVLMVGLVWTRIERPLAPGMVLVYVAEAALLGSLALRWRRRPPQSVYLAAVTVIATLHLCSALAFIAYPEPILGVLPLILAMGTAVFLMDRRWMLGVQAFGALAWIIPVYLAPPSRQWPIVGFVVLVGMGAAAAFRVGRQQGLRRIDLLSRGSRERERESREAAEALRVSEAQLVEAQRIAKVGSYTCDIGTDRLQWSDEHYRVFGWDPEEGGITIQRFVSAVHPDDRPGLVQALNESLDDGKPVDLEFRISRPDGEERVLHGRGETTFDAAGKLIRHSGTSLDITERKRTEEALRASEERLLAILEALDTNKAAVVDRDGIVRSILGKVRNSERYGLDPEEVPGRSIGSFLPGAAGERVLQAVGRVFECGTPEELDIVMELPNGCFDFHVSLRALHESAGEIESVLAIVHDVTESKLAAQALEQARKLETVGVLAGGIAHDFNNLLVGILGNAEVVLDTVGDASRLREPLEEIFRSSERAAELIRQLLAYAGKAELSLQRANLAELTEEMVQLLRSSLSGRAKIAIERGPAAPWIHADVTQIRQVVMNFITNAAEALEGGSGCIRVRTSVMVADRVYLDACHLGDEAAEGEFAVLEVSDDGAGMDREILERIFDPFFTTKFQGRGLGLASTLGVVRSHAGAIRVESEPGGGTTFRVLLPLAAPAEEKGESTRPAPLREGGTILVVDDEDMVRATAASMLSAQGYEVIQASSGREAVELLRTRRIDSAFLDITMPGMDGVETFEALRAIQAELPVVFMSGHSREEVAQRISGKSRTAQLQKPFRLAEMREAIRVAREPQPGEGPASR